MPMTINGTGTVTGLSVGGLPDATVTQVDLVAGLGGTGPAFSAFANVATSLVQSVATKVLFQVEEFDTNNNYDTTTSRFTPTIAGYYLVTASTAFASATGSGQNSISKNGTIFKSQTFTGASGTGSISCLILMNGSTDFLEVFVNQNGVTQNNGTGASTTYFQGNLVRAL